MKKFFILMMMVFSTTIVISQSLDDINEMMGKKDYAGAKGHPPTDDFIWQQE